MEGGSGAAGRGPAAGARPHDDLQPHPGNTNDLGAPLGQDEALHGMASQFADDARREAENLQRRLADQQLVAALARCEFTGRRYERFQDELARYGLSVLRGWMHAGTVFRLAAERGYLLNPTDADLEALHRDSELREDLAGMTIAKALPRFRERALLDGGWRAEGGASLSTYFIGATLYVFPNQFRSWRAQQRKWRLQDRGDYTVNGLDLDRGNITDPATLTVGAMSFQRHLDSATPREQEIVCLTLAGYTQEEIVELLGESSARAIEGVLHRWRKAQQRRLEGGDDHD